MRHLHVLSLILALALSAAAARAQAPAASVSAPQPCTRAEDACVQWIGLGSGQDQKQARSMAYATYPLDQANPRIRRALIMVHGTLRNADHYFTTATGAAFLAGALGDTLVIAPAFHSAAPHCEDKLQPHEVSWSCTGDSWRSGGAAVSDPELSSFDLVDALLTRLADKRLFPNLKAVVVAGHSAGGQFVSRYEMANRVHDKLGIAISYVVANPSSYAWPAAVRPEPSGDGAPDAAALAWRTESPNTAFTYGAFDGSKAEKFDAWPYGFENRTSGYTAKISDEQLRRQLASRPTTYLLSQVDVLPLGGFDGSPQAMAQGATRRARGEAFVKYINEQLGGSAKVLIIPECGHNDRCVYTTDSVLPVIFPAAP